MKCFGAESEQRTLLSLDLPERQVDLPQIDNIECVPLIGPGISSRKVPLGVGYAA